MRHPSYSILIRYFILVLLTGYSLTNVIGQLTINVTSIPPSTPPDDDIHIAGNFNNWNPGNQAYILSENGNGTYSITFSPQAGLLKYKFTRGAWDTVEGNSSGNYIPNRTYNYTGGEQTISVSIAGWEGDNHTASSNVMIVDEDFYIPQLNRTRRVWIYLPPDYDSTSKKYPVLYMHDGQNLFDEAYSFAGEWKIDESMNDLFDAGDFGAIVVGIDNGGANRIREYSPWFNSGYGGGDGELYATFLVNTLKPFIDSTYRTRTEREFTAIAGSSLGANISMYTGIEYQDVFSKIGIFSPAFWFSDSAYLHVVEEGIHDEMRIYFVAGDNESASNISDMMAMLDTLGFVGLDVSEMQFLHHADGAHSEWYWAREFPEAYEWLFDNLILTYHVQRSVKDFIYPNPAISFLRIESTEFNIPYIIYGPLGNILRSSNSIQDTIDISDLLPGFYFLEIKSGKLASTITRFIKQ